METDTDSIVRRCLVILAEVAALEPAGSAKLALAERLAVFAGASREACAGVVEWSRSNPDIFGVRL